MTKTRVVFIIHVSSGNDRYIKKFKVPGRKKTFGLLGHIIDKQLWVPDPVELREKLNGSLRDAWDRKGGARGNPEWTYDWRDNSKAAHVQLENYRGKPLATLYAFPSTEIEPEAKEKDGAMNDVKLFVSEEAAIVAACIVTAKVRRRFGSQGVSMRVMPEFGSASNERTAANRIGYKAAVIVNNKPRYITTSVYRALLDDELGKAWHGEW